MNVTISDVGAVVAIMSVELDRLHCENVELGMRIEHNEARRAVLETTMRQILKTRTCEVEL